MSSFFRQQLEEWVKQIDVKADVVLDIGGAQLPVHQRTKSWDVGTYIIMDIPEPHQVDEAVRKYKSIVRSIDDVNATDGLTEYFDSVFCLEVMEYVLNPVQAIKNMFDFLAPGGTLYISFPFIYPHHAPQGKDYLRYTRWGAEKLLTDAGFVGLEVTARVSNNHLPLFWNAEKMHPMKGYQGHDEIGYMIKCKKP